MSTLTPETKTNLAINSVTLLLAIIAFLTINTIERKKLNVLAEQEIEILTRSIHRDLHYLKDQLVILGIEKRMGEVNKNRVDLTKEIFSRFKKNLYKRPEIFENYFGEIKLTGKKNTIFYLLGEFETEFLDDNFNYNNFLHFAVFKLIWYGENDPKERHEIDKILSAFHQSSDGRIKTFIDEYRDTP